MARFNSIMRHNIIEIKGTKNTYHTQKKTKSLELRSRPKVPPDARQKLALLRLKDVFRCSDAEQV